MSPLSCQPAGHAGTGGTLPPVSVGLTDAQIAQLAADHQAATIAVAAPDVAADLTEAAADAARHLGLDVRDPRALGVLLTLASRSYSHGFIDGAEHEREVTARMPLAALLGRKAS